MVGYKRTRRGLALLTAVLVFMCQTAAAAAACSHSFAAAEDVGSAPCHHSMDAAGDAIAGETAPAVPAASSNCGAATALSQQVELPIFALTDLPPLALVLFQQPTNKVASVATHVSANPCSSPPLTLLHCRFLN